MPLALAVAAPAGDREILRSNVIRNRQTLATPQAGVVRVVVLVPSETIPTNQLPRLSYLLPAAVPRNADSTSVPVLLHSEPSTLLARIMPFSSVVSPDSSSQSRSLRPMSKS